MQFWPLTPPTPEPSRDSSTTLTFVTFDTNYRCCFHELLANGTTTSLADCDAKYIIHLLLYLLSADGPQTAGLVTPVADSKWRLGGGGAPTPLLAP